MKKRVKKKRNQGFLIYPLLKHKANKRGQVWIETVIYTLIAFSLIAAVLAFVKPKIDELQDKAIIEQSIGMIKEIDSLTKEIIQRGAGNKRLLELSIQQGSLIIDGINDEIIFEMDTDYEYSEIGKTIIEGNLLIKTSEKGSGNFITIRRSYDDNYNITFNSKDQLKTLTKAGTSYQISLTNLGRENEDGPWHIDIELV